MRVGERRGGGSVDGGLESMPVGHALRLLVRGLLRVPRQERSVGGSAAAAGGAVGAGAAGGGAVQHLMLALLSVAPGHPYELYQRYRRRFGGLMGGFNWSSQRFDRGELRWAVRRGGQRV
jgi:hypothetical protein